jgi:CMP/dCMP kinase
MQKITLTGDLGSGKSAVSKLLCDKTGFPYVSTGKIQRKLAQEMGMDTLEMNQLADIDPSIDEKIDSVFIELGNDEHGYIVDSRLAWFFLPKSFKVYLKVDMKIAVKRILSDKTRKKSETYKNEKEAIRKISARKRSENERFLSKYGANCTNMDNFDLVIDTAQYSPQQVANLILWGMESRF